jgi:hypothetical protein
LKTIAGGFAPAAVEFGFSDIAAQLDRALTGERDMVDVTPATNGARAPQLAPARWPDLPDRV